MSEAAPVIDAKDEARVVSPRATPPGLDRLPVGPGTTRGRLLALAAEGRCGELIVAVGGDTARIHVDRGRIAWVHRPRHRPSLRDILALDPEAIDEATVRAIVEQSYASRRHFADVAVDLGVRTSTEARACLVAHLRRELAAVIGWGAAMATFIEEGRPESAAFDFELAELMPDDADDIRAASAPLDLDLSELSPSSVRPANDGVAHERAEALIRRVADLPDVSGYCVLDTGRRVALGAHGSLHGDGELAWSLARGLAALGEGAEEMIASRPGSAFLVRRSGADPALVVIVEFDSSAMVPGMARILVADAAKA